MNLHIVTLNIPFPPDYGGMIDTYYRIKALHELGVGIHLHCFEYGRQHSKELESLCETTNYYSRKSGILRQFSTIPYIVSSRKSTILLDSLIRNDYPILFDGLHTTFYINHPALSGRKKFVRIHNIEHNYYKSLVINESNLLKKGYFCFESAKLQHYEKVLEKADCIFPISERDQEYFKNRYQNSVVLAPFHPFNKSESLTGTGDYILYHGDLSVNENSRVVDSLITEVFSKIPYSCIIAGKDPPAYIKSHAARFPNIRVVSNPDNEQMKKLVINSQVNLLPALSDNGFKLKILMALYAGRHLLVNSVIAENYIIKNLYHVANSYGEMINKVHHLMEEPFTKEIIFERQRILSETFDIQNNAKKLLQLIFQERLL